MKDKEVIVFDSDCLMCNGFIQFVDKRIKKADLSYTNFSSDFSRLYDIQEKSDSILYVKHDKIYEKSDAVILILENTGCKVAMLLKLVPLKFRNLLYDFVAKNRYLFGRNWNSCSLSLKHKILK